VIDTPNPNILPPAAQHIATPLKVWNWYHHLQAHPNQELVQYFITGLIVGFRIGLTSQAPLYPAKKNMSSALAHPSVVDDYLQVELDHKRISGPFLPSQCQGVHISRFEVIPKGHQPNKWRLIVDLSHPPGCSVNDHIPKSLCSLSYITIDNAIQNILNYGQHTILAKVDIKSAFRLVPVHPADRHFLGMRWRKQIYIDSCLPFGLCSAPKLFNILADLVSWIAIQQGISCILHYLDDFLLVGPPQSPVCQQNLETFIHLCSDLGIPLASEKIDGPTTSLAFLGIIIDTHRMEIRLPAEKLARIQDALEKWLTKKSATKRMILSLLGQLQHATKVVRCGRTFTARMYATAAKVKKLHYYTRLNRQFRSDLAWWHTFLHHQNSLSILQDSSIPPPTQITIQTDASGSWGCGAIHGRLWLQLR